MKIITEKEILDSLKLREGMSDYGDGLLSDYIGDVFGEVRSFLNYGEEEGLPCNLKGSIKELTLFKLNQDGVQGISSESIAGTSTSYLNDIPGPILKNLKRYRRLK